MQRLFWHIARWAEQERLVKAFAYTPSYALDCKPENVMSKHDYDELKNFWWMDVYAYGRYPKAAMNYLRKKDLHQLSQKTIRKF